MHLRALASVSGLAVCTGCVGQQDRPVGQAILYNSRCLCWSCCCCVILCMTPTRVQGFTVGCRGVVPGGVVQGFTVGGRGAVPGGCCAVPWVGGAGEAEGACCCTLESVVVTRLGCWTGSAPGSLLELLVCRVVIPCSELRVCFFVLRA